MRAAGEGWLVVILGLLVAGCGAPSPAPNATSAPLGPIACSPPPPPPPGSVAFQFDPPCLSGPLGLLYFVNVVVASSDEAIDEAEAHITFDPTKLQVTALTPNTQADPRLDDQRQLTFSNTDGTIDLAYGREVGPLPPSAYTLATITFSPTAATASTQLTLVADPPRRTRAARSGTELPVVLHPSAIQAAGAAAPSPTTVVLP